MQEHQGQNIVYKCNFFIRVSILYLSSYTSRGKNKQMKCDDLHHT